MMAQQKMYGYIRVSTREQNEERQRIALLEMGVPKERIYMDKLSGKDFERPQYKKLLRKLDDNSVLYVKSIDRLGRNYCGSERTVAEDYEGEGSGYCRD